MRWLRILEFSLAAQLRRPLKTAAILAVYTLMVTVIAAVLFLTQSLKREAGAMLADAPELVVQMTMGGRHELTPLSVAKDIAAIPGVRSVVPRVWGYYYDALVGANYTLQGVDGAGDDLSLLDGHLPGLDECAIGSGVATARLVGIGDDLILIDHDNIGRVITVSGIFSSASDILAQDLIVLPTADLRSFFGMPEDRATDLAVRVYNPSEVETIAGKVKRLYPEARPITRREILRTYDAVFDWRGGMMLALFGSALLAFVILAWDKATGLSAGERREIGILKAIGWDTGDILLLKFWEGLAISLLAFVIGCLAAFLLVFFWGAPLIGGVMRGWSVLFPALHPTPFIEPYQVATLAFSTIVPYIAATILPAWRAAIADPDEVMRT